MFLVQMRMLVDTCKLQRTDLPHPAAAPVACGLLSQIVPVGELPAPAACTSVAPASSGYCPAAALAAAIVTVSAALLRPFAE